jgi:CobQ-like glutamine amidotransferase family enzyme
VSKSRLGVVQLFPGLSFPQGDGGNAWVLVRRAALRGIDAYALTIHAGQPVPSADIYLLGGAADEDLAALARRLRGEDSFRRAVADGSTLFAVGAGYAAIGERFAMPGGSDHEGVGLLDVRSTWVDLADGPVVTKANPNLPLPAFSAWESHHGRTSLGPGATALAALEIGVGNGDDPPTDGAVAGHVVGTCLHGPVLARSPELADLLLGWAVGETLAPADTGFATEVNEQRIAEARLGRRRPGRHRSELPVAQGAPGDDVSLRQ